MNQDFVVFTFGICDLEFGIWNLEFGIWNLEFGIWNLNEMLQLKHQDVI
jgi:hypothetical protein